MELSVLWNLYYGTRRGFNCQGKYQLLAGLFIVNPKNKETLSSPGRFGFLTEPE